MLRRVIESLFGSAESSAAEAYYRGLLAHGSVEVAPTREQARRDYLAAMKARYGDTGAQF